VKATSRSVETIYMTGNFGDEEKQVSASEVRDVSAVDVNNRCQKQTTLLKSRLSHSNNSQCFLHSHKCSGNSISLDEKLTSDTTSQSTENVLQSKLRSSMKVTSESFGSQSEYSQNSSRENFLSERSDKKKHTTIFGKGHQEEFQMMVKTPEKDTVYK